MLPVTFTLGATLSFTDSVADYPPAEGWALKHRIVARSGDATPIGLTAAPDSANPELYRTEATAAVTAAWISGAYSWVSWVERDPDGMVADDDIKVTLASGSITLLPDPRVAHMLDVRSQARIALDDAKAALAAWSPTTKSYTIGQRQMEFNSPADILAIIAFWQAEVRREEAAAAIANNLPSRRRIFVRLARA